MSRKVADQGTTKINRKLPTTPRSRVRAALSQLFLRSRERAAAIKRTGNRCESCGAKFRPKATTNGPECRVTVHHLEGGAIDEVMDLIFKRLLCDPARLKPLCGSCHDAEPGHNDSKRKDPAGALTCGGRLSR